MRMKYWDAASLHKQERVNIPVQRIKSEKNYDLEEANEVTEVRSEIENKCDKCEFVGKNEAGLKIHCTAKHKVSIMRIYRK